MSLSLIEKECKDVLVLMSDYMAPGHRLAHLDHRELAGKVRDCVVHLTNKEYGCATGRHSGPCSCAPGVIGKSIY